MHHVSRDTAAPECASMHSTTSNLLRHLLVLLLRCGGSVRLCMVDEAARAMHEDWNWSVLPSAQWLHR